MTPKTPQKDLFGILRDKKVLILRILIVLVVISGTWLILEGRKIEILSDKTEYQKGENLKLKIKNRLIENICFSSCYPYLLERQDREWKSYIYGECQEADINETCIKPGQTKAFEITLFQTEQGLHRIRVSVCKDCKTGEDFKSGESFYSNEFEIK